MPRESRVHLTVLSAALVFMAACDSSGSSVGPPIIIDPPELAVVNIEPQPGAEGVDPYADILVTFNLPVDELPAAAWVVDSGTGALPGQLGSTADGLTWVWRPDAQMPRGVEVTVQLASGIRSRSGVRLSAQVQSTYKVREASPTASFEVPNAQGTVLVWPNGRRAATMANRCYEYDNGVLLERPFLFGQDDLPYGDGWFLTRVGLPGSVALARRSLDGAEELVGLPNPSMQVTDVNSSGDVVLVLREQAFSPTPWQLFRLQSGAQAVEFLGTTTASESSTFEPKIAEDGAIVVAFVDEATAMPTVWRVPPGATAPQIYEAPETGSVGDVYCGVAADGVATIVWLSGTQTLRAATLEPGGALMPVPNDVELLGPSGSMSLKVSVALSGSTAVEITTQVGVPAFVNFADFIRLERTGWVGFPVRYGNSLPSLTQPQVQFDSVSGDWWVVRLGPALGTLERLRSRPGMGLGEPSLIYEAALTGQFIEWFDYGIDEFGRAMVALREAYPVGKSYLVVLQ